eukprot:symbB.v1.2.000553.t1/scaffold19.1/size443072/17
MVRSWMILFVVFLTWKVWWVLLHRDPTHEPSSCVSSWVMPLSWERIPWRHPLAKWQRSRLERCARFFCPATSHNAKEVALIL